jgi:hypothetical protein
MISTQTLTPASVSPENPLMKTLRITTGIMLAIQGALFFSVSCFIGIITLLVGSLAFLAGAGAGAATDEQVKATGLVILLMVLYPFAWTLMLVLSSINILLRKRPWLIITLCFLSILSEIGLLIYMADRMQLQSFMALDKDTGWKLLGIITMLIPLAGVAVAFMMTRRVT